VRAETSDEDCSFSAWRVSCVGSSACCFGLRSDTRPGRPGGLSAAHEDAIVAQGRDIAVKNCSTCHAVDDERTSPNPAAPPLLSILMRYDSERLAEDFVEGTRVGHDEMPHFDFTVREADALIAYLKAIERTPRAAEH